MIQAKNDKGQRCIKKEAHLAIEIQKRRHSKGLRGVAGAVRRWLKHYNGIKHMDIPASDARELAISMRKYTRIAAPKKANADAVKAEVEETIDVAKRLMETLSGESVEG